MAGTVDLSNFLTSAELTALPDPVKSKIESHVQTLNKENEELKSIYERLRVNTEQQHFEIEKQLIASNTKLEADSAANTQLREQVAELEKKYNEATEKLKDIKTSDEGNLSTKLHLSKINEQLECEKREFAVLLEKRNREIDNKNDEVKELSQKLSEAITAKCEAMAKLDEVSSNQMNRELVIKRLEQELENLKSQMEWQDKDLKEKTKELMNVRRDKSSKLLEVQAKLEEKTEECSLQQATIESLRKTNSAQTTKIDQLIQRVKDVQDSNSQSEEQFRQEIQARIRLVDLYKNSAQEAENKATELTGAVTELQKLLQEAATAHTELENEKDDEVQQWKDEVEKRERKIGSLEQELVNANDLLSAMKQRGLSEEKLDVMFPTAAATSKLLKSGMSLTQIYNEYVQATDSLQLEKEENKRLNTYLDQILQEIEQKAPLLKKQREDYDIALKSIDQMTRQLDAAMVDCQNLQAETDESNRKSGHLTKENQRQQQQIKDLSDQVRYLVKEVEELQGGRVVRDEVSSTEVSSSSRIISDKLVTFRNIEEMQEQNQKLLSVIRELSDKQEQEENSAVDSKTRALSEQLEMAHEELSVLKDARTRQAEMVESIVRQRDMYRVLLQQANITPMPLMPGSSPVKDTRSPGPQRNPEQDKKLEETGQALKQLQAEINSYKKDKIDNEKMLYDQIDKDRKEMSDLRLQNAKLASQLDFAAERYKVLQGNAEGYRKEISIFRDKIQKYNTSTAKYEQSVNSLKQELLSTQEQLSQVQAREENLRREKDIIRSTEMRLTAEMESMRRERNSQSMLMANLQAIQNNLERTDRENKRTLSNQIEALEREKTYLRKRLETEERQHGTVMKHLEHQAQEHRKSLDLEMKAHQETRNRLSTTAQQLQENKQLLESTTAQLQAAEARLQNLTVQESGIEQTNEEIRDLKSQLLEKKTEVESLHAQLEKTRGHAEQYKTIADTLQHTIKQQNQASEEFKESLEEKLREADEKVVHLDQRVDGLEKERQELLNENLRITEERHSLNGDLRNQLSSLQNELQEAVERRETAVAVEMSAKQECEHQTRLAAEAQDKYERELMLHAASVDALGAVKKQLESYNTNLSEWEEKAKIVEKTLEVSKTSWDQREKLLIAEKDRLASRVEDLIGQTRALHDQMSKLSNQVITVQERAVASTQNRAAMGGKPQDDSTKSSEQLLEVIKFLRKEKDIAEGRLDVVETECSRMKQRCEALERQVEAANTDLAEERRNAQAEIQTASQHADLMMKVESYNLLHDSNKLLREEKEHLQATVTATEAKLSKLEEQIRPLQEEIRELTAQRDSLTLDKRSALAEVDRWRARTTQLIEQSHKTDPEEHRRLIQEKEELRKQMTSLTEELHKAKAEATKQSVENAKLQRQLTMATEKQTKLTAELKETKEQLEEQSKDSLEKSKMVQQLKKIGRKYKEQAEIMTKEFDDYKASHVDDDARIKQAQLLQQANEQKLQEATAKLEASEAALKEMAAKHEETIEKAAAEANAVKSKLEASLMEATLKKTSIEQQVTSLTAEKKQLEAKVQNLEAALKGHSTEQQEIAKLKEELAKQTKLEAKLKEDLAKQPKLEAKLKEEFGKQTKLEAAKLTKLREEMLKVSQELSKVQQELHKVQEEKGEQEKSNTKMKSMLVAAKTKLQSMKDINEKLTAERLEMKKRLSSSEQASSEEAEAQVASLKTMYDNQIQKLEKDVATKTEEIVELQAKIVELQTKLQQLQSSQKLGPGQSQVQPSRSTGTVAAERISSSTSELPKTANIRPIASSPVAIKPQTVPVQPQSAASKATASIRPMAIAPTTVSPMPSTMGTPTATVMPTTVTQQEQQMEGDAVSPVQQLFPQPSTSGTARPTQQVQRVIPTQESSSMEPETSGSSGTETGIVEPQPSSSRETPVAPIAAPIAAPAGPHSNKRQRDDLESPGEDTTVKRTKVTTVEESPTIPEIHVTDESAAPVTQVVTAQEPEGELDLEVPTADDEPPDEQTIEEVEADDEGTADIVEEDIQVQDEAERQEVQQEDDDSGDVIIVASDEEEGDEDEEDEEEENEEEEEEEEGDEDDYAEEDLDNIEYIDENPEDEMDEEHGFDQDEGLQAGDRGTSEDDDVVIIELGEDDDGAMSSQEPTSQPSSQPSSQTSHTLLPPLQQPLAPERQLSVPRNQLTPFMLGSTAGFEDMDDCTVPSTPTLNVPRRGDGFAEAVSSPQVSQRFIFGSGGSEHNLTLSGLAQLDSQAGMGMDDTRMDLSQLEEGSGRSVPSTPLHTSAPVTVISDIADPGAADTAVSSSQGEGGEGQDETDQGQLGEEEGLEGDGEIDEDIEAELGDEDFQPEYQEHEDGSQDIPGGDGGGEASTSQGDGSGSGMGDKDAGRPKIQKIVWDAPAPTPQATGSPIQTIVGTQSIPSLAQPVQQYRPARGVLRGVPQSRGSRGTFTRGQTRRPMRGGRGGGGMYTRRPPMY